jgi:MFS family permease
MNIQNPLAIYKGLPRPIYVLFLATVINSIGIFVYPFLALYLVQGLHYSSLQAGRFLTIASVLYVPGSFLGSKLADSFGRKPVLVIFQILMNGCYILCGFLEGTAAIPYLVLLALFFDGAVDPAREALKTDVTSIENRQASFSLVYLGFNLGFSIGPMIAGFLFYTAPRWIFWGNGLAGLLSTVLVVAKVRESKPTDDQLQESKKKQTTEKAEDGNLLSALKTRPTLILFALCTTFYSFAYSQILFALPLLTTDLFGMQGSSIYGLMMAVNGIVVVLFNPVIVKSLRKNHPLMNSAIAGLLYAVGFSLLAVAKVPAFLYLLSITFTIGEIISATNDQYYVANNTPMSHRARFSAILPIIMGTGHAVAPIAAGSIINRFSMSWVWITSGGAALLGAIGIAALFLHERGKAERND